jgi:aspartyl-tRNA(Asn)/glutamyl-tRNA(Gln) amidotransferase subunit A
VDKMINWPALKAANAPLNAFVDWDEDAKGGAGPLAGLTLGVKSNIMVKGLPWTGGMGLYRNRIAERDAEVVARLRNAGATVLGMLNMHEAALGAHTDNAFFGRTHNPHRHGYTPGGSSGGSGAAVAAGLCDIALGTDTLGSVRIPAAYCGVYGLKPTHGAVSSDGLAFLEPALDCIGPLAASLDLIEAAWRVMADNPSEARRFDHALLLGQHGGEEVDPAVAAAFDRAIGLLPMTTGVLDLPDRLSDIRKAGLIDAARWLIDDLGAEYRADNPGLSEELKYVLKAVGDMAPRPEVLARSRAGLRDALGDRTVLIIPTAPQSAFAHGERAPSNQANFTSLASISGLPALSLPAGWTKDGLPVGVQLVGPPDSELSLIDLARRLDSQLQAYRQPAQFRC